MAATRQFYVDHGVPVAKSFGRKYVEFDIPGSPVKLALYGPRALAKDAGVPEEGTGSHRLVIGSDAGPFTDPDGFTWESGALTADAGLGPAGTALAAEGAAVGVRGHADGSAEVPAQRRGGAQACRRRDGLDAVVWPPAGPGPGGSAG